jgi:hypothetical protein
MRYPRFGVKVLASKKSKDVSEAGSDKTRKGQTFTPVVSVILLRPKRKDTSHSLNPGRRKEVQPNLVLVILPPPFH